MIQPQKKVIVCHKHRPTQDYFASSPLQLAGFIVFIIIVSNTWEILLLGAIAVGVAKLFLGRK